jgi:hypothetical protein
LVCLRAIFVYWARRGNCLVGFLIFLRFLERKLEGKVLSYAVSLKEEELAKFWGLWPIVQVFCDFY